MTTIKHSKKFRIKQPIDILFPLFSAEGEKYWVPGWDYKNIMGSTDLHEDYIFVTQALDHEAADIIWLVKKYQPESHFVQFYKVEPEEKVGIVTVECTRIQEEMTEVDVSYEYIALGEKEAEFIKGFTATHYDAFIGEWESLLNSYFESLPS